MCKLSEIGQLTSYSSDSAMVQDVVKPTELISRFQKPCNSTCVWIFPSSCTVAHQKVVSCTQERYAIKMHLPNGCSVFLKKNLFSNSSPSGWVHSPLSLSTGTGLFLRTLLGVVAGETSCAGTFTKMSVRLTIKTSKTGAKSKVCICQII